MKNNKFLEKKPLAVASVLGLAVLGLGIAVGRATKSELNFAKTIAVEATAEEFVKADLAIWRPFINIAGASLPQMKASMEKQKKIVVDFLKGNGFSDGEIRIGELVVTDKEANAFGRDDKSLSRYVLSQPVVVISKNTALVEKASGDVSALVEKGIVFGKENNYDNQIQYSFTTVDSIKPDLMSKAVAKTRAEAEKIADAAKIRLGGVVRVSYTRFNMLPLGCRANEYCGGDTRRSSTRQKAVAVVNVEYEIK
ncbi:MAG: SIMPL domain-containing protein [Rickettsiales bacterium]|jgi:hypothetical protein|nr:SIMPL domain-containing protein [Rickettsiales bacterium]